jgi:uncharacterized protein YaaQ
MTINANSLNLSANRITNFKLQGAGSNADSNDNPAGFGIRDRRFDCFVSQVSQNFVERLSAKVESSLKEIMDMSPDDKRVIAHGAMQHMKRLTQEAIEHEERELERFNRLQEQKAHYQEVLNRGGFVRQGQFGLSGVNNRNVSRDEVSKMLEEVQKQIDDLVSARQRKESDPFDLRTFEFLYAGATFLAAASAFQFPPDAAKISGVNVSGQWSRTEGNFVQESQRSIKSLNRKLEDIDNMYSEYNAERILEKDAEEMQRQLETIMEIFSSWNTRATLSLMQHHSVNEEQLIASFSQIIGI